MELTAEQVKKILKEQKSSTKEVMEDDGRFAERSQLDLTQRKLTDKHALLFWGTKGLPVHFVLEVLEWPLDDADSLYSEILKSFDHKQFEKDQFVSLQEFLKLHVV